VWSETRNPFFNFALNHVLVIDKARHFKYRVVIDIEEYESMHDILLPKGMCSESRNLFKFWEISDNILETVIDTINGRLIENRMWPIEWHHCQCP